MPGAATWEPDPAEGGSPDGGPPSASGRRVSVVIPVKDDAAELARCLDALRAQRRRPDEIVVVDNESHDDTAAVARSRGAVVVRCAVAGIPAASAAGYDAATGDVILRLDADCVASRDWVQRVLAELSERPDIVALSGPARFVDGPRPLRTVLAVAYLAAYAAFSWPALGHRPLFGSNLALRASTWHRIAGSVHRDDPQVHDDLDLSFHVGAVGRIRRLRGARMGISMRPFFRWRGFRRRFRRGVHTVVIHWPAELPPRRWLRQAMDRGGRPERPAPRIVRAGAER